MGTTGTAALLAGAGGVIALVAFLGGRRVEAEHENRATIAPASAAPIAPPAANTAEKPPSAPAPSTSAAPLMPLGNPTSAADLFTRLQQERESRLQVEPTADSVFDAMTKRLGVQVDEHLQVAGFVVGARFCDKVRTKQDVHVVVCEYTDEESAKKGVGLAANASMKRREVLRNKTTTCAVHQADAKEGAAEAAKVKQLFKAM